jgi:ribosome biogenesis protein ERB1
MTWQVIAWTKKIGMKKQISGMDSYFNYCATMDIASTLTLFISQINVSQRPTKLPEIEADYDSDSSTEDVENAVGNVPMEWYDDFPHIGYDIDGKRVLRPAKGDELEKFLSTMDDPDSWRSVSVDKEGKDMVLNDEELDIIRRIQGGDIPDADYNPYEPTVEWFSSKKEVMPLSAAPEPKRRFIPSKWEAKKVQY